MERIVFEVEGQDFKKEVLESSLPILIEFTADWCAPCKMLAPVLEAIARKYKGQMRVGMLDTDNNQQIVQEYGVFGMPTMILYIDGKPVERIVGYKPQERIESKLLPHLSAEHI